MAWYMIRKTPPADENETSTPQAALQTQLRTFREGGEELLIVGRLGGESAAELQDVHHMFTCSDLRMEATNGRQRQEGGATMQFNMAGFRWAASLLA